MVPLGPRTLLSCPALSSEDDAARASFKAAPCPAWVSVREVRVCEATGRPSWEGPAWEKVA